MAPLPSELTIFCCQNQEQPYQISTTLKYAFFVLFCFVLHKNNRNERSRVPQLPEDEAESRSADKNRRHEAEIRAIPEYVDFVHSDQVHPALCTERPGAHPIRS